MDASELSDPSNPRVFLEISIDGKAQPQKIVIELMSEECPRTCENFLNLITGQGEGGLSYAGSPFHRIMTGFMAQGGDVVHGNGTGAKSSFGGTFKDENFKISHCRPGVVSMSNAGKDTNACQFFITFHPCEWLDGVNVAFGLMESGFDTLRAIEKVGDKVTGKPSGKVIITSCGIHQPSAPGPRQPI
jgi:cyclophilin family peptidyl-prolyl cis-trans isomerase